MTADTVVLRCRLLTCLDVQFAASLLMARQTLCAVKSGCRFWDWLLVGIVARDAGQTFSTRSIALAQLHRLVMFQQVGISSGRSSDIEDRNCFDQRFTRTKVRVAPARQQHSHCAALMALHA